MNILSRPDLMMQALQKTLLKAAPEEVWDGVRAIEPAHVALMISRGDNLRDALPPEIMDSEAVQMLIAKVDASVLVEVLSEYHPGLAAVLGTDIGMAWLERQR